MRQNVQSYFVKCALMLYYSAAHYNVGSDFSSNLSVDKWKNRAELYRTRPQIKTCGSTFPNFQIKYAALFLTIEWVLKLNHQSQWSLILNFKDDGWADMQLKSTAAFFKVEELISSIYITDQYKVRFRFYYFWAERTISMYSRYFRFKTRSFFYY